MGYTALCFCSSNEFLSTINSALTRSDLNFTLHNVNCQGNIDIAEQVALYNPNIIIIDFVIGKPQILNILSSIQSNYLSKRLTKLLAVSSTNFLYDDIEFFSEFDDFIEYPKDIDSLPLRIELSAFRRKHTNKLLENSEQLNDISLAASKAGSSLLIIDGKGEIVWVNKGFELLYECNLDEFREKFGRNVFETKINSNTATAVKKCAETGEHIVYESIWFTNSNKRKNIQTSLTPIYDSNGALSKIIAIETDITDLKMAEEALSDKHDNLLSIMEHLEDANRMLDEQRNEIEHQRASLEEEKNKSDALLLNILPDVAAHQLKKKGFVKPKKYSEVSVMFADFVNFSSLSVSYASIEEFLAALSYYFESFDEITTKRFIEKIKTIGDCYMCVGGVPQINKSNPFDTVLAALEAQKLVEEKAQIDQTNGNPVWRLRIGIHTGSVMAGVIGKKKFAYDVWGDTVNIASRMESKGEAGKVNISETTYNAIQEYFECRYRGKVMAKNIGEINMYFVERIKPEYSEDSEGYIPNAAFRKELAKY
jgi:PAS domain S-box-containing protein